MTDMNRLTAIRGDVMIELFAAAADLTRHHGIA
jgi:hypothetical protein